MVIYGDNFRGMHAALFVNCPMLVGERSVSNVCSVEILLFVCRIVVGTWHVMFSMPTLSHVRAQFGCILLRKWLQIWISSFKETRSVILDTNQGCCYQLSNWVEKSSPEWCSRCRIECHFLLVLKYTVSQKNDADVAHYNCNTHSPSFGNFWQKGGISNHHSVAYSLATFLPKSTRIGWCMLKL